MEKKSNKPLIYFMIVVVIVAVLAGTLFFRQNNNNGNNDKEVLKEKIMSEISYLDSNLIDMLNKTNGISLENYIVQAEEVKGNDTSSEGNNNSSSGGEAKEGSGDSSSSKEGKSDEQSSGEESSSTNNFNYKMVGNEILSQDRTTDWEKLKQGIEKLYSDWNTIVLDLYKININNQDILNFNSDLDVATSAIKSEDKAKTLTTLSKLYSYIPKYTRKFFR